ncbi:DBP [simian adenovirus 55]|uniref:DNA-binding protein n=1 Tax=simian adenovirus 55 TaxID=2848082 RepID=A0A1L3INX6_9ADEN|nr:DBP [Simian mastadenovirus WIV19]APG53806.1 DBP [Simian mastadenovirus WIV19]
MASRQVREPTPVANEPPKKKAKRTPLPPTPIPSPDRVSDSGEEDEVEPQAGGGRIMAMTFSNPPMQIVYDEAGNKHFKRLSASQLTALNRVEEEESGEEASTSAVQENKKPERPKTLAIKNPLNAPITSAWEKGMQLMHTLMEKYSIDKTERAEFHFLSHQYTVYRKICNSWLQDEHKYCPLTFTTNKTFGTMMGRFLHAFVNQYAGIVSEKWEPTGCVVWEHRCTESDGELRCLHGLSMITKEQLVEMDVTSETGQRALKDSPARAKIVQNRWGRNVVQLRNEDARCCMHDASCGNNVFSSKSCGMFFSEGAKAQQAFKQFEAFMAAAYPHMDKGHKHLLMPLRCECNYLGDAVPRAGRQVCKMTPFSLSHAEDMDTDEVTDPVLRASLRYPTLMVFQCANPVYRNTRASNQINCDFKISAPDVLLALQLTRQLWHDNFNYQETPVPKLVLPEFKWHARYQYKNITLPTAHVDAVLNPFEF